MQKIQISGGNSFDLDLRISIQRPEKWVANFLTASGDIGLHLDIRVASSTLVINTCSGGQWGCEAQANIQAPPVGEGLDLRLQFHQRKVVIELPKGQRFAYVMNVPAAALVALNADARLLRADMRSSEFDLVGISARDAGAGAAEAGKERGLIGLAIDCDGATMEALEALCDQVIDYVPPTVDDDEGSEPAGAAAARDLAAELNRLAQGAGANVLVANRMATDVWQLSNLVQQLWLRSRGDRFFAGFGQSFRMEEPWLMAFSGGQPQAFGAFVDAVSPLEGAQRGRLWLQPSKAVETLPAPMPQHWRPAELSSGGLLRHASRRIVQVRLPAGGPKSIPPCTAMEGAGPAASGEGYSVAFAPVEAPVLVDDCLLIPDLPRNRRLPSLVRSVAAAFFATSDVDGLVVVQEGGEAPIPASFVSETLARFDWVLLREAAPNGLRAFMSRPLAGRWEFLETSEKAMLLAEATEVAAAARLTGRTEPLAPDHPFLAGVMAGHLAPSALDVPASTSVLPQIALLSTERWLGQQGQPEFQAGLAMAFEQLARLDGLAQDWSWVLTVGLRLGVHIGVQARTQLLQQLTAVGGVDVGNVCEQAARDSMWEREWANAQAWFEAWRAAEPESAWPLAGLVRCHLAQHRVEQAQATLEAGLAAKLFDLTTRPLQLELEIDIHERAGRWAQMLEVAETLVKIQPPAEKLLVRTVTAALHIRALADAQRWLRELKRRWPKSDDTLYLEARLAQMRGRYAESAQFIDKLVEQNANYRPLANPPTAFKKLGSTPIRREPGSVNCIFVARNEGLRLPWVLDYYKNLGATNLVVIDNGSDDESIEYLLDRGDVAIYQTLESYGASRYGVKWHNELADELFRDEWVLVADADEVLVYPHCDEMDLPALCRYLDEQGAEGLQTFMLDMYPEGALRKCKYEPGSSLIEASPMFDTGLYQYWPSARAPYVAVSGGVRERFFWRRSHGFHSPPPALHKVPLVKWREGMRFLSSTHECSPLNVANISGALLHFKFLQDFHARAAIEAKRKEHYNGGSEYAAYNTAMEKNRDASFVCDRSGRFSGWQGLMDLKLLKTSEDFEANFNTELEIQG